MFMRYAVSLGLLAVWALGGRLDGLAQARLRFAWLFILATFVRLVVFETAVGDTVWGMALVPVVNVGIPLVVLVVLLPNLAYWGARLALIGVVCNLLAIATNGGWMPVQPDLFIQLKGQAAGQAVIDELTAGAVATT